MKPYAKKCSLMNNYETSEGEKGIFAISTQRLKRIIPNFGFSGVRRTTPSQNLGRGGPHPHWTPRARWNLTLGAEIERGSPSCVFSFSWAALWVCWFPVGVNSNGNMRNKSQVSYSYIADRSQLRQTLRCTINLLFFDLFGPISSILSFLWRFWWFLLFASFISFSCGGGVIWESKLEEGIYGKPFVLTYQTPQTIAHRDLIQKFE